MTNPSTIRHITDGVDPTADEIDESEHHDAAHTTHADVAPSDTSYRTCPRCVELEASPDSSGDRSHLPTIRHSRDLLIAIRGVLDVPGVGSWDRIRAITNMTARGIGAMSAAAAVSTASDVTIANARATLERHVAGCVRCSGPWDGLRCAAGDVLRDFIAEHADGPRGPVIAGGSGGGDHGEGPEARRIRGAGPECYHAAISAGRPYPSLHPTAYVTPNGTVRCRRCCVVIDPQPEAPYVGSHGPQGDGLNIPAREGKTCARCGLLMDAEGRCISPLISGGSDAPHIAVGRIVATTNVCEIGGHIVGVESRVYHSGDLESPTICEHCVCRNNAPGCRASRR